MHMHMHFVCAFAYVYWGGLGQCPSNLGQPTGHMTCHGACHGPYVMPHRPHVRAGCRPWAGEWSDPWGSPKSILYCKQVFFTDLEFICGFPGSSGSRGFPGALATIWHHLEPFRVDWGWIGTMPFQFGTTHRTYDMPWAMSWAMPHRPAAGPGPRIPWPRPWPGPIWE